MEENTQRKPFFLFSWTEVLIRALAIAAGAAILLMIGVTLTDIILRIFKTGIQGAYDIVRIAGVISISCALPYLTAVKGHIAIEFLYQHFSRIGRIILDSLFRLISIGLFGFLVVYGIKHGISLKESGQMMMTLKVPVFWIPFVISFNSLLMMIIIFYHLIHPGKEMIKP
jgi:TRAP-type C4-dicarboxylate transport system permease small subunit